MIILPGGLTKILASLVCGSTLWLAGIGTNGTTPWVGGFDSSWNLVSPWQRVDGSNPILVCRDGKAFCVYLDSTGRIITLPLEKLPTPPPTSPPPSPPTGEKLTFAEYYTRMIPAGQTQSFYWNLQQSGLTGIHIEALPVAIENDAIATFTLPNRQTYEQPIIGWDRGMTITLYPPGGASVGNYILKIQAKANTTVRITCTIY